MSRLIGKNEIVFEGGRLVWKGKVITQKWLVDSTFKLAEMINANIDAEEKKEAKKKAEDKYILPEKIENPWDKYKPASPVLDADKRRLVAAMAEEEERNAWMKARILFHDLAIEWVEAKALLVDDVGITDERLLFDPFAITMDSLADTAITYFMNHPDNGTLRPSGSPFSADADGDKAEGSEDASPSRGRIDMDNDYVNDYVPNSYVPNEALKTVLEA